MYNRMVFPAVAFLAVSAFACGDKLMLLIGGAHLRQVYSGAGPATILAYAPPASRVTPVMRELERLRALREAGYSFHAVEDEASVVQMVKAGKYDLLLADVADAAVLEERLPRDRSRPLIVPVLYRPTKTEAASAKKKFSCVLKAPANPIDYLAAIDHAVELRRKTAR